MAQPDMSEIERGIMDLASEDDYGLWELLWHRRSTNPTSSHDDQQLLLLGMDRLLDSGDVVLVRRAGPVGETREMPIDLAKQVLRQGWPWREPDAGQEQILVRLTADGADRYFARSTRRDD